MRIKRKNGLKVAAITIALLLCLALAVGITGAWYQAKRQATGTLRMDQGIIIDYNGFDKIAAEDWATWTRGVTLPLFSITDAQPGQNIPVNAAGIRANEKSVNFYARVKLSYKFYNNGTEVTTLPNASDSITTSANFFGTNWVDGGSSDGYYYYATGSTLNKFEKGAAATTPFVNLFATDAKFIIEGAGFTGADNNGESGGFKIDGTTSINKIEVYLTLETLQGDATAEQAKALGWKIASPVKFAEATGKMETSVNKTATTEDLNVSVAGATEVPINEVVFPYDTDTTLKFDSNNVEYITLTYDKGEPDIFDAKNYEVAENTITVKADSSKGKVTGYVVGLFSDSEYTGFTFANYSMDGTIDNGISKTYPVDNGLSITGCYGNTKDLIIKNKYKVRTRDFKVAIIDYKYWYATDSDLSAIDKFIQVVASIQYPCYLNNDKNNLFNSIDDLDSWFNDVCKKYPNENDPAFKEEYPTLVFTFEQICENAGLFSHEENIKDISYFAFKNNNILESITIQNGIEKLWESCIEDCPNLKLIVLPTTMVMLRTSFWGCSKNLVIKVPTDVEISYLLSKGFSKTGTENGYDLYTKNA